MKVWYNTCAFIGIVYSIVQQFTDMNCIKTVKEKVEVYLYSSSWPSWPLVECPLPLRI